MRTGLHWSKSVRIRLTGWAIISLNCSTSSWFVCVINLNRKVLLCLLCIAFNMLSDMRLTTYRQPICLVQSTTTVCAKIYYLSLRINGKFICVYIHFDGEVFDFAPCIKRLQQASQITVTEIKMWKMDRESNYCFFDHFVGIFNEYSELVVGKTNENKMLCMCHCTYASQHTVLHFTRDRQKKNFAIKCKKSFNRPR